MICDFNLIWFAPQVLIFYLGLPWDIITPPEFAAD
jgi:hypothetical protein